MATSNFDTKYASNINSLAKANNVDIGQAKSMFISNLKGTSKYSGGGVLDFGAANKDLDMETRGGMLPGAPGTGRPGMQGAQTFDFDTKGLYNATLNAKKALLEQNYNSQMNTLDNNYNSNMAVSENHKSNINDNYEDSVKGIQGQTYRDVERSKTLSAQRGIMNSQQGMAADQSKIREGNDNVNTVTKQRNQQLNELMTQIDNLTKTYGNDKMTAQTNYGIGQTGAQNEALAMKLNADMDIGKFNTNSKNQFGLQQNGFVQEEFMQGRQFEQEVKMFGLNSALQLQMQRISEAGANSRAAAGNSLARERFEYEKGLAESEADKAKRMALIQANPNYNPDATTGYWDRFYDQITPWDTKNEKAYDLNRQAMNVQGYTQAEIDAFSKDAYITGGGNFYNWAQDLGSNGYGGPSAKDFYIKSLSYNPYGQ